jgi:membrane protease YdiL (CAAX protease family)
VSATAASPRRARGFLLKYFVVIFSFTWFFWWLAVLEERGLIPLPIPAIFLGAFGPMVAAVALTARESGRAGIRSLLGRVVRWRVVPIWYGVVLLGPLLVQLAAMALHTILGGPPPDLGALIGVLPLVLAQSVYFLLFVALPEEVGWRGYALPRLQTRFSAILASVILGVIWAFWHLPLFFNPSTIYPRQPFVLFLAFLVPFTILITWVYNGTGGSLLLVMLLHALVNASSPMWRAVPEYGRMATVDAATTVRVNLMITIVLWGAAIAVVFLTGPRDLSLRPRQVSACARRLR